MNPSNTPWFYGQHLQAWRHVCLLEEPELLPLAGLVQEAELLQLLAASWEETLTCQGGGAAFPEQQEDPYCWALLCLMRLRQMGPRCWAQPCLTLTLVGRDQLALQPSAFWPVLSALLGSAQSGVVLFAVQGAQEQPYV